ncbi:MAG: hypothetical protein IAE87_06335 [Rhodobacteraceae bacterium]|nr:hypothetical protein [Paracoccaceae bacterium]
MVSTKSLASKAVGATEASASKNPSLFWPICAIIGVLVPVGQFGGDDQSSAARTASDAPRSGFAITLQEVLACETSSDYGRVGRLWREGQREEADYHARKHCILIPKGRKVLLVQGGFTAGMMSHQELEVDYLGSTRRLFTATGGGIFFRS